MNDRVRRVQELRRSNAAGPHGHSRREQERDDKAPTVHDMGCCWACFHGEPTHDQAELCWCDEREREAR